ncbi:MAG: helix-turn-helix domain-containing protein [Actinomycetales bacterium]|nr:helix-turn-helix domain-containing protein [Actinomycetales bacterium]
MRALAQAADDDGDIVASLDALVRLRREADRREAILVRRARAQGLTWAEIAFLLGVSRQAVHKKYGGSRFERRG